MDRTMEMRVAFRAARGLRQLQRSMPKFLHFSLGCNAQLFRCKARCKTQTFQPSLQTRSIEKDKQNWINNTNCFSLMETPGLRSAPGAPSCTMCASGRFAMGFGSTSCLDCEAENGVGSGSVGCHPIVVCGWEAIKNLPSLCNDTFTPNLEQTASQAQDVKPRAYGMFLLLPELFMANLIAHIIPNVPSLHSNFQPAHIHTHRHTKSGSHTECDRNHISWVTKQTPPITFHQKCMHPHP